MSLQRVAVIGAGPAGSVCAHTLASRGLDVVVYESKPFPRVKVCGEFVSPAATAELEAIVSPATLRDAGAGQISTLAVEMRTKSGDRAVEWEMPTPAWALSRASLDELLLSRATNAGADVRQPVQVRMVHCKRNWVEVRTDGGRERFDAVVHADGSGRFDPNGPRLNARGMIGHKCHLRLPETQPRITGVRMRTGEGAYVGTIEVERGLATCALVARRSHIAYHGGDADAMLASLWPEYNPAWRDGPWLACGVARSRFVEGGHERSFRAGNAAAAVDPVGGEGIGLALWSGRFLGDLLAETGDLKTVHARYRRHYLRRLRLRRPACRFGAELLMRPALVRALWPILGRRSGRALTIAPWYALSGKPLRPAQRGRSRAGPAARPIYHRPMPVLTATNLHLAHGDRTILGGVSLSVHDGERVGVVGRNGQGKSTLMKLIGGVMKPDAGEIAAARGANAVYVEQEPRLDGSQTLIECARAALESLDRVKEELEGVFERMAEAEGDELDALLKRQALLETRLEAAGGYAVEHRVEAVLHGLGFTDAQFSIPVAGLSGGQRSRLALSRALLSDPDALLLDEPTNHLDIEGRVWLERFLADDFRGAVVLVSHDRRLLDHVVHRIVEVESARLFDYPGNYSAFRDQRLERKMVQQREYEKQQTRFKREEAFIRKYKAGQRAKQAKGRESRLEREKTGAIERPIELKQFDLKLPPAPRTGEMVVSARGLSTRFTDDAGRDKILFDGLDLTISRGDRIGIVGPNGAGKTTLIRTLLGEIKPGAGEVRHGTHLRTGYFSQVPADVDPETTVIRFLQKRIAQENPEQLMSEQDARNLAGAFLFSGDDQDKPLGVMSGGERARASIAALLASAKNVLVLDEPTNHLDLISAERLEDALSANGGYEGTLLLISHDRTLIERCCDRLLVFDGAGGVTDFPGSWGEWELHEQASSASGQAAPGRVNNGPKPTAKPARVSAGSSPQTDSSEEPTSPKPKRKSRFSWMKLDQVEVRMHELQGEIEGLDEELGKPETWTDTKKTAELNEQRSRAHAELDELEEEWLHRLEE
ncbi:MAG: ATP-binding cassette domain-containing protein [Planctomycetota bacterium]